jgi:hypothetical protein
MKMLWNSIVGEWVDHLDFFTGDTKISDKFYHAAKEGIQYKDEILSEEVHAIKVYKEHLEDPKELRKYIESKMENDYFYKPYTIIRSLKH